jgi:Protein of unknown function (DUF2934)
MQSTKSRTALTQGGETPMGTRRMTTKASEAAHTKSVERGGEPGHELDDWLQAERESQTQRALLTDA